MTETNTIKSANYLILIFIILTLLLSLGGNLLYRYQKRNITIEKYDELAAISKLKVEQISNWRRGQMNNARIIFNNQAIIIHINEYNRGINRATNNKVINNWVNSLFGDYDFTMLSLVDPSGKYIFNTNPSEPLTNAGKEYIEQARLSKKIIFSDLFRYNDKNIYMDLVVPLYLNTTKKEGFSGVAFLRIDPYKDLYPNILKWPTPGHSNEVILLRREGDSVYFLSDLQHRKNSALRVRKPMTNKNLLIVQALNGKKGILQGVDYRGVKVLGDVESVPDSPWYVGTKIDADEIFSPIITLATWLFIITFLLILISAMIIYLIWKKQANQEIIINRQHLQELVDEQTIYLTELNQQLQDDIAERKLIEEKLKESEERLSFHFENSPLAVVEWDTDYIVTQWSKEAERIFGWKATETLGKPIGSLNMIYEEDIPIVNNTMERLSGGIENVVISTNRNHTKRGEIIECTWYNTIFNDEEGKMASVMSLVEDITERKKAENEIRKLSLAVEQNPISIVITDLNGVIEYGNPKVSKISGYTPQELIGKKPDIFKSGETPDDVYKELWTSILLGKDWHGEILNKKKNGELYWEATSISPITDSTGRITHFLAIKEDITQSKQDKADLIKAKDELEIRVLERTLELSKLEERFRITLDNLNVGCMFIGYDWTYLYANDAIFSRMHGTRESMIGHSIMEIFPGAENTSFFEGFKVSMEKRIVNHYVTNVKYPDGSVNWLEIHVEPVAEGIFVMSDVITDRILAEQKLKKSESDLKYVQHLAKIGYWDWDIESNYISWSDELYSIMGIEKEVYSAKYEKHNIIYTPESWEMVQKQTKRAIDFGESFNFEAEFIRHDNQKHGWINTIGDAIKNESGKVIRIKGSAQDITERKLFEKKIFENENNLKIAQHIAKLGYWDWVIETDVITWSDELHNIFGIEKSNLLKLEIHNTLYTPESLSLLNKCISRTIEFGESYNIELEFHRFDTEERGWMTAMGYPEKDDTGKVIKLLGTAQDITDRKLAEKKLQVSEEGFRTLAESMPQFVWITDDKGMNTYFNEKWTEYTGLSMEESHGSGWNKPFHPEDQLYAWEAWKLATETGGEYAVQCRLLKNNGEYHWFIVRGIPLKDNNGKIIRWYGTCTEIDSQKQIEVELENRVNERTSQLQIANKELEAFSYSVSHDLRAPLRSIDGWSMALLEDCADQLDKQGLEYLDRVREETQRMGHLIDDLLKLSRVSRAEIKKVDIDLSSLAQDIKKRLLKTPTERRIEFIIQPGMFTFGDPRMLDIALTNLLDNAYKFTGKKEYARIEFGQTIIDDKQTYWVRDNGVGFDMSYSKNLFGAFQRMHRQSDFPGTGVGLATVQRIIHRHDGLIWAESKINEGATFYFTLT